MKLDLEMYGTSLKKVNHSFFYTIDGGFWEEQEWHLFTYLITFDEKLRIINEDLKTESVNFLTLKSVKEDNNIQNNLETIKYFIESMDDFKALKEEELKLIDENYCEFSDTNDFEMIFQWKEEKEFVFVLRFSKTLIPTFFSRMKNEFILCDIEAIVLEEMKKIMRDKMKMHSKEKVRLLTNGYQLNVQ